MNHFDAAQYLNITEARLKQIVELLNWGEELNDRQIQFVESLLAYMVENSIADVEEALARLHEEMNAGNRYGAQQEAESDRRLVEDAIARRYTALKVGANLGLAEALKSGIVDDWLNQQQRGAIAASERVLTEAFTEIMQADDQYLLEMATGKRKIQWSFTRPQDLLLEAALDN